MRIGQKLVAGQARRKINAPGTVKRRIALRRFGMRSAKTPASGVSRTLTASGSATTVAISLSVSPRPSSQTGKNGTLTPPKTK